MSKLNLDSSLQEVYDYLKETPEDKWGRGEREDYHGNRCALGWIDLALEANGYNSSVELIEKLIPGQKGVVQLDIVDINNDSPNSKAAVLKYLEVFLVKD